MDVTNIQSFVLDLRKSFEPMAFGFAIFIERVADNRSGLKEWLQETGRRSRCLHFMHERILVR